MAEVRHRSDEGGASSPFTRRTGPGAGETTHAFSNSAAPRVDYVAGRAERNRVARPRLLEPEILSKSDYCENGGAVQLGGKVKSVGVELAACKTLASPFDPCAAELDPNSVTTLIFIQPQLGRQQLVVETPSLAQA